MTIQTHMTTSREAALNSVKAEICPAIGGLSLGSIAMFAKDRQGFAANSWVAPSDRLGYGLGRLPR